MQNDVLHNLDIQIDALKPIVEELCPIFGFEIWTKWNGIGTIPQPWCTCLKNWPSLAGCIVAVQSMAQKHPNFTD